MCSVFVKMLSRSTMLPVGCTVQVAVTTRQIEFLIAWVNRVTTNKAIIIHVKIHDSYPSAHG